MADENTTAPAAASDTTQSSDTTAAEGSESAVELREALVERLKANRASRERGTQQDEKPAKSKRGEAPAKPEGSADDEANAEDTPEQAAYKADRRAFAKQKRKKEAEFASREAQLSSFEQRANAELESAKKDPVAWLKGRGVNLRKLLTEMATEETEDPRDKKLRELEQKMQQGEEETKRERAEREARESKANQAKAIAHVESELGKAWQAAEVDDYPTVAAALEPEHVSQRAAEIAIEHFREWVEGGRVGKYKELAPTEIFQRMEDELTPLRGKLANGRKKPEAPGAGPGSKRDQRKAATPEAPSKRERPNQDVTRRTTREPTLGRPQNFDRESLRERLVEQVRANAR